MMKEIYHPNAYLNNIRNLRLGLRARTKILNTLEKGENDARTIAEKAAVPYSVAMHHLKLLLAEGIVNRRGSRPYVWTLTGVGQKRLVGSG
jgi:predicted transcriptional regulator